MTDEPVYQWQRNRDTGGAWENIPDPHPGSVLANTYIRPGDIYHDGIGNMYRRIQVNP